MVGDEPRNGSTAEPGSGWLGGSPDPTPGPGEQAHPHTGLREPENNEENPDKLQTRSRYIMIILNEKKGKSLKLVHINSGCMVVETVSYTCS